MGTVPDREGQRSILVDLSVVDEDVLQVWGELDSGGVEPGDFHFVIPSDSLHVFGLLMSQFHNAWMRTVAGRLKSDYRNANTIVYNNFVWPGAETPEDARVGVEKLVSGATRQEIERCAQAVLDARTEYDDATLADLYDPNNDWLYPALTKAHQELDAAVERAYGVNFGGDETRIVAHLFGLYAQVAAP